MDPVILMTAPSHSITHLTTVHQPFDPRIFYKQLASLRDAGFDTHLIAPHDRTEQVQGISIHALPQPTARWRRIAFHPTAFRMAQALNADLYQVHDPELLPVAFLLREATGARIVYDMHENYRTKGPIWGRALRTLERWAFRWVDHVLIAEESYRSIVEAGPVSSTYIPNYFRPIGDARLGAPAKAGHTPTRLLYTGTLSASRGLRTMVELAARIRRAGRPETIDLVGICRYEKQRAWAKARVQEEDLNSILSRVGWDTYVLPSTMPPYYRRADVGLALFAPHPNHRDSIPTKFYEYLHYGLPLICSDVPRWRRFVKQHECGAVVPPGEPEAVLDVLDTWQASPEQYRKYAENARAAASQYRWASVGQRLVDRYRSLLGDGAPERHVGT